MRSIITSTVLALAVAVTAAPAAAETAEVSVPYRDLDLSSAAGTATLEGRIQAAARRICGSLEVRRVRDGGDYRSCLKATHASVTVQVAQATGRRTLAYGSRL